MGEYWNTRSSLGYLIKWFKFLEFFKNENCNDRCFFSYEFWIEFKDCELIEKKTNKNNNI